MSELNLGMKAYAKSQGIGCIPAGNTVPVGLSAAQPEIMDELSSLQRNVDRILDCSGMLVRRLEPIMLGVPGANRLEDKVQEDPCSQVGITIRSLSEQLKNRCDFIESAINSLAI